MQCTRTELKMSAATLGVAGALLCAPVFADGVEAIYTKIPGHPTAEVPGASEPTTFRQFDQLTVSPTGKWVMRIQNQLDADFRSMILIGEGNTVSTTLQEGFPFPGAVGDEVLDFTQGGAGFNDDGDFAFRLRARGGAANVMQKIMKSIDGNISVAFQGGNGAGGDPYIGLEGPAGTPIAGNAGNSIGSTHLLNSGMIGTHDTTAVLPTTLYRPVLAYDLNKFKQRNVDTVVGLNGVGIEIYGGFTGFSSDQFWASPDFEPFEEDGKGVWIAKAFIDAPTSSDEIVVVNDQIMMRESFEIPGTGITFQTAHNVTVLSNNDWYVRGAQANSAGGFAVRNGELIAKAGDPIGDSGENWTGTSFSAFTGNNNGDWVLAGQTDNGDTASDHVIVVNGEIVVREGDPVKVDGADVFIGRVSGATSWQADSVYLTDDNVLYCVAAIWNGVDTDYAGDPAFSTPYAFLRIDLNDTGAPCPGDLTGDGSVGVPDLLALLACWGDVEAGCEDADLVEDGSVGVPDLLELLSLWGDCK